MDICISNVAMSFPISSTVAISSVDAMGRFEIDGVEPEISYESIETIGRDDSID